MGTSWNLDTKGLSVDSQVQDTLTLLLEFLKSRSITANSLKSRISPSASGPVLKEAAQLYSLKIVPKPSSQKTALSTLSMQQWDRQRKTDTDLPRQRQGKQETG